MYLKAFPSSHSCLNLLHFPRLMTRRGETFLYIITRRELDRLLFEVQHPKKSSTTRHLVLECNYHTNEAIMSSYTHFTLSEQKYLQESGYGSRAAARALGHSPSTVSREIRRNWSKSGTLGKNSYHHWRANALAVSRRRTKRQPALPKNTEKRKYVEEKLWCFWSPEQIAERWKLEHPGENLSLFYDLPLCQAGILLGD